MIPGASAMTSFDLQVNGYAGVDFSAPALSLEQVERACAAMADEGVAGALVAIVTADLTAMIKRIERMARFMESSPIIADVIKGIHVEGPFISNRLGYVGAHPPQHTRDAD